jgi:defect in organelle trafficking protein DotC
MKQLVIMFLVGTFTVISGCTTPTRTAVTDPPLYKYHAQANITPGGGLSGIRYQSLREAALSTGARAGLAWRASQINVLTESHAKELDLIYNFTAMLLDNNVLPPVLIEGRQNLEQTSDDIIRVSDRAYSIQSQARFVTMAPTWREYLRLEYADPGMPDSSLLPRSSSERIVWDRYVDEGWQAGVTQADVIFTENLGRLKRDYQGMVIYRTLLAQNMVSLPYVAQVDFGITGGDAQMAINDRVFRITAKPQFNIASNEWKTQMTPQNRQPAPDDR